jgi:hypothetical protein
MRAIASRFRPIAAAGAAARYRTVVSLVEMERAKDRTLDPDGKVVPLFCGSL